MTITPSDHHIIRRVRRRARVCILLAAIVLGAPLAARVYIHRAARDRIFTRVDKVPHCRVALVLGAGIKPDGRLSMLLEDRVKAGVALYRAGVVDKLLMSGDNRFTHHNEPKRMCDYAIKLGVPSEDVAMDFAGRRTYDSVYRAKHIFGLTRFVVVSQSFHLDRAIFLCDHVGVKGCGFAADVRGHRNSRAELRELGASVGAVFDVYFRQPRPVMGKHEPI